MENIYTILEKIEFEKRIKTLSKSFNVDEFRLSQSIFSIVQEFYDDILDEQFK